ncbi:unnamed protein product [Symbiodinium sp. CCMP2456]|nr:unnamed protein product [Symbiodinium sp. CCMP2456]
MLLLGNEGKVELDWALMLLALHMWRRASAAADRKEFLVDNELLQAPTSGLSYFFSKSLHDARDLSLVSCRKTTKSEHTRSMPERLRCGVRPGVSCTGQMRLPMVIRESL